MTMHTSIRAAHEWLLAEVKAKGRKATRPRPLHVPGTGQLANVLELPALTIGFEAHASEIEVLKLSCGSEITDRQDRRQLRDELVASWLGHNSREGLYTRKAFVHAGAGDCPVGVGVICTQVVLNVYVYELWMPVRSLDVRHKALADFAFAASLLQPIMAYAPGSPAEKFGFVNVQVQNAHVYL